MRVLLDTHVFLWWLLNDNRLSQNARKVVLEVSSNIFLSSISAFEIATKVSIGKLTLPMDIDDFHAGIVLKVLPKAGNKHVHAPAGRVAIVLPYCGV